MSCKISRRRSLATAIAFPLGWRRIAAAPPGGQPAVIRVTPTEDHRVFLFHDGYQAEWQIRFPEVVSAREGTFLTSTRPRLKWREYEGGTIGTDWRPDEDYSREAYEKMGRRLVMVQGMEVSPRMKAGRDRIDLELLRLKNVSDHPFHAVSADGGCLQHRTERFFDQDLTTSYMLTTAGLTPLSKTHRSAGIRAKYYVNPDWFEMTDVKAYEFFWGRSEVRPAGPLIVSEARQGPGAIGIAWDECIGVRQNSDPNHRCMHSSPYFGDMQPGQTVTRRGVILFGDTAREIEKRFRRENMKLSIE
jgi:hypothetical protein